jgi:uncharacterized repeat protein (TIGR03803 family)
MKTRILLILIFLFTSTFLVKAQYTKLFDFVDTTSGQSPYADLVSDGTYLYGMTYMGGTYSKGLIFKIKPDGTAFDTVMNFSGTNGANPLGSLIYDGTYLYGMTNSGGTLNFGTIFKIMPDGTGYSNIRNFGTSAIDGLFPNSGTFYYDGTFLYGMTGMGGTFGYGNLFKIKPDGTGFSNLLNFTGPNGTTPNGSLISDGTYLYGMTVKGGTSGACGAGGCGTVFKIKPDGTGYVNLLNFNAANGRNPNGSLYFDGSFLYGTTAGSAGYWGNIFKIKPDGTGFVNLFVFTGLNGARPRSSFISVGSFLYGMTDYGGANDKGIIFRIKTDGTGFSDLFDFSGVLDGAKPGGSLIYDGTSFYGMTSSGGTGSCLNGCGTIFRFNDLATEISENNFQENISIYPNPASNKLFLQSDEKFKNAFYVNYLGQSINLKLENNSCDISNLSGGIYFLSLTTESGKVVTKKFVKK